MEKDQIGETVILNERKISVAEFEKEKTALECKPGVTIVRISEGIYRTQIRG